MSSVFIVGFMASGKSEVGQLLSQKLNVDFVDLDTQIEKKTGQSIAGLFELHGEAHFRKLESEVLKETLDSKDIVVSTGGGTPFYHNNIKTMQEHGTVVHLATGLDTCLERAKKSTSVRPLFLDSESKIKELYQKRIATYRESDISVNTEDKSPAEVAQDIEWALKASKCLPLESRASAVVSLGARSYSVVIEPGCLPSLGQAVRVCLPTLKKVAMISDRHVFPLYGQQVIDSLEGQGIEVVVAEIEPGEKSKSISVYAELCESLIAKGLDRSSGIVALGGGVVGDLAGFVAATLFRGIALVQVPTTVLAMTDSAIGGKTGINSLSGKNLMGAFWQPSLVWADPLVLSTLPLHERKASFGELLKYALLDASLWLTVRDIVSLIDVECLSQDNLQSDGIFCEWIRACAAFKAGIVSEDECESGLRAILNLGHTVGHAIETFSEMKIRHGEAVALGLMASCRISHHFGLCEAALETQVSGYLEAAGLENNLDAWLSRELLEMMSVDKKRTGSALRFVAIAKPGDIRTLELDLGELINILLKE